LALLCVAFVARAAPPGLHGKVVDRGEKPIAGAKVTFFPRLPLPDVRVRGVPFHTSFELLSQPITDEAFDEVLRLATIESKPLLTVTTRADGTYDAPGIPFTVDALITAPDGARATFTWSIEDQWPEAIVVPRDAPREVVVNEYPSGKAIPDAEVIVVPHSPRTGLPLRFRTNASGVAVLSGLPDSQHALTLLRAKGFMNMSDVSHSSLSVKPRTELVMLKHEPLRGRVVQKGKPVAGARVEVVHAFSRPVKTDARGEFVISDTACVGCELLARSGTDVGLLFIGAPTRTPSTVEVVESGAVHVRAYDSTTRALLPSVQFGWSDSKDRVLISPFTSDDAGVWTADSVTLGKHGVSVQAEGYLSTSFDFEAKASAVDLAVPLLRNYEFSGFIDGGSPGTATFGLLGKWPELKVKGALPEPRYDSSGLDCDPDPEQSFDVEDGTFHAEGIAGEYLVRIEERCSEEFWLRIPEAWPEYCDWLGTTFGVDEPRRRGDAYVSTHCQMMEARVQVPLKGPLVIAWKPMFARVFVEAPAVDDELVSVSLERGGKVETWAVGERAQFLVLPGTYVVHAAQDKRKAKTTVTVTAGSSTTVKLSMR
jgi:hypothetical protein